MTMDSPRPSSARAPERVTLGTGGEGSGSATWVINASPGTRVRATMHPLAEESGVACVTALVTSSLQTSVAEPSRSGRPHRASWSATKSLAVLTDSGRLGSARQAERAVGRPMPRASRRA